MGPDECSNIELQTKIAKLEADLNALRVVLDERDIRYAQRADSQDNAVAVALSSSKEATTLATAATERRLEILNELRKVVLDQSAEFARKAEVNLLISALELRIRAVTDQIAAAKDRGLGVRDALGWLVAAAGLVIAALAVFFRR